MKTNRYLIPLRLFEQARIKTLSLICFFVLPLFSFAAVITVPGDYSTIQAAIDAANDGDEIVVSQGTYVEIINLRKRNIILRSTDPTQPSIVASTIIDGNRAGNVVEFWGTESKSCVLSGFTITNGYDTKGGGIYGNGTMATIQNNIISGNSGTNGGGLYWCNGTIENNVILGNNASNGGGLVYCNCTIRNNNISDNDTYYGGGLAWCDGTIQNNTIYGNSSYNSGGGLSDCHAISRIALYGKT